MVMTIYNELCIKQAICEQHNATNINLTNRGPAENGM